MPKFDIEVQVVYYYEVEAESKEEAEKEGWMYENYPYAGEVDWIKVSEQDEEDEEEVGDLEDE
jgi:hypothetical protein